MINSQKILSMIKPLLYKLFAVQSFNKEIIAVYTKVGEYPDPEILTDSIELVRKTISFKELKVLKPWKYAKGYINGVSDEEFRNNIKLLNKYTATFKKGNSVLENSSNVDKAIFVNSIFHVDWHGEQDLYYNKDFSLYKSSYPTYSSCEFLRKIKL